MHEKSEVLSSVAAAHGNYTVSSILSILNSGAFDVGLMIAHIQSSLDCRRITKCSDSKAIVENGFEMVEYGCRESGSERLVAMFR